MMCTGVLYCCVQVNCNVVYCYVMYRCTTTSMTRWRPVVNIGGAVMAPVVRGNRTLAT